MCVTRRSRFHLHRPMTQRLSRDIGQYSLQDASPVYVHLYSVPSLIDDTDHT